MLLLDCVFEEFVVVWCKIVIFWRQSLPWWLRVQEAKAEWITDCLNEPLYWYYSSFCSYSSKENKFYRENSPVAHSRNYGQYPSLGAWAVWFCQSFLHSDFNAFMLEACSSINWIRKVLCSGTILRYWMRRC